MLPLSSRALVPHCACYLRPRLVLQSVSLHLCKSLYVLPPLLLVCSFTICILYPNQPDNIILIRTTLSLHQNFLSHAALTLPSRATFRADFRRHSSLLLIHSQGFLKFLVLCPYLRYVHFCKALHWASLDKEKERSQRDHTPWPKSHQITWTHQALRVKKASRPDLKALAQRLPKLTTASKPGNAPRLVV